MELGCLAERIEARVRDVEKCRNSSRWGSSVIFGDTVFGGRRYDGMGCPRLLSLSRGIMERYDLMAEG